MFYSLDQDIDDQNVTLNFYLLMCYIYKWNFTLPIKLIMEVDTMILRVIYVV